MVLSINEEFYSIQGEGIHTGIPMYFVRLQGCTVGCYFCDTKYTWREFAKTNPQSMIKEEDIIQRAKESKAKWLCITGGEPYEQDLDRLLGLAFANSLQTHIETSGTVLQYVYTDWICLSPKDLFSRKQTEPEFKRLANEIKCVVTKPEDVDYYIRNYYNPRTPFILNMVDNKTDLLQSIIEKVRGLPNVRIMHQCHKVMGLR